MDSKSFTEQRENIGEDLCQNSVEYMDGITFTDSTVVNVEQEIVPLTPDNENGDFPVDLSSPVTLLKKMEMELPVLDCKVMKVNGDEFASVRVSASPQTPKDVVFDPFAPGPADKVLAPYGKKYLDVSKANVARRLNFTSLFENLEIDDRESSEEEMLESAYENLLEAILYNQTEGALSELSNMECDSEACRTPSLAPRLKLISDTCPGAPLRPSGKPRNFDLGLCRKLEF